MSFNSSNMSLIHWGASWLRLFFDSILMCTPPPCHGGSPPSQSACSVTEYSLVQGALAQQHCLLANGSAAMGPLLQVTSIVPIVFVIVPDPVGAGCMSSEHFGQLAWQFKRMSGSSGLKVQAAIAC